MPNLPLGQIYQGAYQSMGSIGEGIQKGVESYALRKQKEKEFSREKELLGLKGEQELKMEEEKAKLKQLYPDPLMAVLMKDYIGKESATPATSREEVVSRLVSEGKDPNDFKIKEGTTSVKGMPRTTYIAEEIPKKIIGPMQEKAINDLTYTINLAKSIKDKSATGKYKTGPASYRYSQLPLNQMYMGLVGKPEEAAFKSDMTEMQAAYASAKTGTQRGFKEIQWLEAAMPSGTLTPEQIVGTPTEKGVADATIERLEKNLLQVLTNAKKSRYDISGFEREIANLQQKYKYIRTGINKKTGEKIGVRPDGTEEVIK